MLRTTTFTLGLAALLAIAGCDTEIDDDDSAQDDDDAADDDATGDDDAADDDDADDDAADDDTGDDDTGDDDTAGDDDTSANDGPYLEQGGLVVIEIESAPLAGDWAAETSLAGYTGTSYYAWRGPDLLHSPGSGVLAYDIEIGTGGTYNLRVRNRHDHPDSTLENDVFVQMDGGDWVKLYSQVNLQWTWSTRFDFEDGNTMDAAYDLTAGVHTLAFSGRSYGFMMDRLHLYLDGTPNSTDPSLPESPQGP